MGRAAADAAAAAGDDDHLAGEQPSRKIDWYATLGSPRLR